MVFKIKNRDLTMEVLKLIMSPPSRPIDCEGTIPDSGDDEEIVVATQDKGKGKTKKDPPYVWNRDLEEILCSSFIDISKNSIIGNNQKHGTFWSKIVQQYNEQIPNGTPPIMKVRIAMIKFSAISTDVNLFVGCMKEMDDQRHSGCDDSQQLKAAKSMFKERHKKNKRFVYEGCWRILKDHGK
ncbi:hypothetical protein M5689_006705 [Euphorbia peplus]|nr:hypothetical protein M5689_006705 [Euphorbia peplus]